MKWQVKVMYGSPDINVHKSVVAEKYLAIWHSILPLNSETNLGIATSVKCLWVDNWYLGLNLCSIARNPGLSTVDIVEAYLSLNNKLQILLILYVP